MLETYLSLPIVRVSCREAGKTIEQMRREGGAPVIVGTDDDEGRISASPHYPRSIWGRNPRTGQQVDLGPNSMPADILEKADAIDPERWFQERRERFGNELDELMGEPLPEQDWAIKIADENLSGGEKPSDGFVYIARLPTDDVNEAPAYLAFGGWNEAPGADEQVAIARYWGRRWGARIAGVYGPHGDSIRYDVANPPTSRKDAIALACEHYLFCDEIEDILEYAESLMGARGWGFWWD